MLPVNVSVLSRPHEGGQGMLSIENGHTQCIGLPCYLALSPSSVKGIFLPVKL